MQIEKQWLQCPYLVFNLFIFGTIHKVTANNLMVLFPKVIFGSFLDNINGLYYRMS